MLYLTNSNLLSPLQLLSMVSSFCFFSVLIFQRSKLLFHPNSGNLKKSMLEFFIEHGCNVNVATNDHDTALHVATKYGLSLNKLFIHSYL